MVRIKGDDGIESEVEGTFRAKKTEIVMNDNLCRTQMSQSHRPPDSLNRKASGTDTFKIHIFIIDFEVI